MAAGYDSYNYGTAQDGGASGNYGVIFKTDIVNHKARYTLYTSVPSLTAPMVITLKDR
jgi:hypothetical protein